MHSKKENSRDIRREASNIRKCAALTCSRIVLLICLFFLILPMRPTSVYLFFLLAIFPWIFGNILAGKRPGSQQVALPFCAKKYLYTPARYLSEKYTGNGLVILLIVWQLTVNRSPSLHGVWKISPACCLLVYCLCRLVSSIVFRRKIRQEYFGLKLLDR